MALILYRILFLPLFLMFLPYYGLRMWRRGGYGAGLMNRAGWMKGLAKKQLGKRRIWLQAVSVGELNAVEPLLQELAKDPSMEVLLTTTTSTGLRLARDRYEHLACWIGGFPLDFWPISVWAWRQMQADLVLLMEGELWPEHIHQAWKRQVPVVVINGRLSDRSYSRQKRFPSAGRSLLGKISWIIASSEFDRKRFTDLHWISPDKILNAGNLKFDFEPPPPLSKSAREKTLVEFGFAETAESAGLVQILMGSSTWPGEEEALLEVYERWRADFPRLRLLLVPRHAERRKEIEANLRKRSLPIHFRSDGHRAPQGTLVYVGDTTGELKALTRLADIVFVGKSLPPNRGGQTPMEAAALGKPLLFGPHMENFRTITRQLLQADAAQQIETADALSLAVGRLLKDSEARTRMASRAASLIEAGRGATLRTLEHIRCLLPQKDLS